tara:strand:+ start:161 stop:970 length:810 start_codon:yes stop_codon:yes gene_type:complete
MRPNTLTEGTARLLKEAGCVSVGMSLEHGNEDIRNRVLKRGTSDEMCRESYAIARKYGIKAQCNVMLGIPGTTIDDDIHSIQFLRELKAHCPTIGIFCPIPGTELTEYTVDEGYFDPTVSDMHYQSQSVLNCFTDKEKLMQQNIMYLGIVFAALPKSFDGIFRFLIKLPLTSAYFPVFKIFWMYRFSAIFPKMVPFNLPFIVKIFRDSMSYFSAQKKIKPDGASFEGLPGDSHVREELISYRDQSDLAAEAKSMVAASQSSEPLPPTGS